MIHVLRFLRLSHIRILAPEVWILLTIVKCDEKLLYAMSIFKIQIQATTCPVCYYLPVFTVVQIEAF